MTEQADDGVTRLPEAEEGIEKPLVPDLTDEPPAPLIEYGDTPYDDGEPEPVDAELDG